MRQFFYSAVYVAALAMAGLSSAQAADPASKDADSKAVKVQAQELAASQDDTPACLSKCKNEFDSCSDGGTKNVPYCVKKRKECIDACK